MLTTVLLIRFFLALKDVEIRLRENVQLSMSLSEVDGLFSVRKPLIIVVSSSLIRLMFTSFLAPLFHHWDCSILNVGFFIKNPKSRLMATVAKMEIVNNKKRSGYRSTRLFVGHHLSKKTFLRS